MKKGMAVLWVVLLSAAAYSATTSCEKLAALKLPHANVTSAEVVAAGAFPVPTNLPPYLAGAESLFKSLPAFCRVRAAAHPSADSNIKVEIWMPAAGWNGRFQGQGNGGFAGQIDYRGLATALSRGYATAATDTGHSGNATDATWALGHPEKIVDFGYRGIHEMTRLGKSTIKAFYGANPKHSYFGSCSNGGRQALMEAQRFPEDYDGILAGAPANYWTHLLASALWNEQATTQDPASYIPSSKLPAIASAVNDACDRQDGVADGILSDPRQCHFDPAALTCKESETDKCLTAAQVTALKKLYQGPHDSSGQIFPGFPPGAEEGEGGWSLWITGPAPGRALLFFFGNGYFSNMIYNKADWNYKTADISQATKASDAQGAKILNATDPDLARLKSRGGKVIIYHGWNDPAISAINSIDYYNRVVQKMGAQKTNTFVRLYMVPGMQHCGGGPGESSLSIRDVQLALEDWVEKGVAPSKIVATTKSVGSASSNDERITRPLCPYPQGAKYKGTGDPKRTDSFACAAGEN